jgi:hypothetical protein
MADNWLIALGSQEGVTLLELVQDLGRTVAQEVSRRFIAAEAPVLPQGSSFGIRGGQRGTGAGFSTNISVLLYQLSFRQCSIVIYPSVAGTMDPWATVPRDSVSPYRKKKNK